MDSTLERGSSQSCSRNLVSVSKVSPHSAQSWLIRDDWTEVDKAFPHPRHRFDGAGTPFLLYMSGVTVVVVETAAPREIVLTIPCIEDERWEKIAFDDTREATVRRGGGERAGTETGARRRCSRRSSVAIISTLARSSVVL